MPVLSAFSAAYCSAESVVETAIKGLDLKRIDQEVIDEAASRYDVSSENLVRAMVGPAFAFNKFTHRRQRYLAYLRVVLAEKLDADNLAVHGYVSQLIPREIGHVLRACLLADPEWRADELRKNEGMSAREAHKAVRESDERRAAWTSYLFGKSPWDHTLYDVKIPLHSLTERQAVDLIAENFGKPALAASDATRQAVADFQLAARAGLALIDAGHLHTASAREGIVTVIVDDYALRFEKLADEVRQIVSKVDGVRDAVVRTGPNYRPPSVFAKVDFELPEKVLLVDDEKDFVLTLSERLVMRDLEPAIAYDGEEALEILGEEEPDVMVLDLKMPGIDGIEVLRRVKNEHPDVEVVILTGHGDEKDREVCMELGAFAYLEKPVDMEVLSETLKAAKAKIRSKLDGEPS